MKKISAFIACTVCKAVHAILRLFGRGGTAFPGRIALRICPDVLEICARGVKTLAITGTNGKTTSARMTETALKRAGLSVFSNRSGANLIDGICCEFILNTDFFLRPKCKRAVIECDEAASRRVLGKIYPDVLLVTNLFRDQLDRYGTVEAPRDAIADGLKHSPNTVLCLNADCPMASSIAQLVPNRVVYYGFSEGEKLHIESGEDDRCVLCGGRLHYDYVTYANLGSYRCTSCGAKRHDTDVTVEDVTVDGSFVISAAGERHLCRSALGGLYNIYNALGVIALLTAAGLEAEHALSAAGDFECGFGRMERFELGSMGARMILIKNAAAADQTLEYIKADRSDKTIVFAVNDREADGTDISWIYDADFEKLRRMRGVKRVYTAGDRAEKTAFRLQNAGIACETVENYDILFKILSKEDNFIYLLPTYTAMLELRKEIVKRIGGKNFWE